MAWVTRVAAGPADLRHGYTLDDLNRLTRYAIRAAGYSVSYVQDRYDTAWSAIAEALYAAPHPMPEHDLVAAGRNAIWQAIRDHRRHHGHHRDADGVEHGSGSGPNFNRFWDWVAATRIPSPEARIVERHTVRQIMPGLSVRQRQVVEALAVAAATGGGYDEAIRLLAKAGVVMTRTNFIVTLSQARRRFLYWWHEGEMPSRPWGYDRPGRRVNPTEIIRKRAREAVPRTRQLRPTDQVAGTWTGYRTRCPAGHPYDEANTYVDGKGHRHCRQCKRDRRRAAALQGRRI